MENLNDFVKISDPVFHGPTEDGVTGCTLEARLNLKELERQTLCFTQEFIKNKLSLRIPVVYSVFSTDYQSGMEKCRARYLLKPDGTAVVLKIDRDYYRGEDLPSDRETVKASSRTKAKPDLMEYCRYDYTETVQVSAEAVCCEGDSFDASIGQSVAFSKAFAKLHDRIRGVFGEIAEQARLMASMAESASSSQELSSMRERTDGFLSAARKGGAE